VGSNGLKFCST